VVFEVRSTSLNINNSRFHSSFIRYLSFLFIIPLRLTDDVVRGSQTRPSGWIQKLDDDSVSIEGSVLATKTINHDINRDAVNRDEGPVAIVGVDLKDTLKVPSTVELLLDLVVDLEEFFVLDPLLVTLFVFGLGAR
jgi:hypothetical protein